MYCPVFAHFRSLVLSSYVHIHSLNYSSFCFDTHTYTFPSRYIYIKYKIEYISAISFSILFFSRKKNSIPICSNITQFPDFAESCARSAFNLFSVQKFHWGFKYTHTHIHLQYRVRASERERDWCLRICQCEWVGDWDEYAGSGMCVCVCVFAFCVTKVSRFWQLIDKIDKMKFFAFSISSE